MFKDLYKSANDKIPTEDAYLRVMKKVSKESSKTKYNYTKVAMLAACLVLTVSMISVYDKFSEKTEEPFEIITSHTIPSTEIESAKETTMPAAPDIIAEPVKTDVKAETKTTLKPDIKKEETVLEVKAQENGNKGNLPLFVETVSDTKIAKNQGIPEGSMVGTARFYVQGDIYTKEDYAQYLGKNIEEVIYLPENYKNESPNEQILSLEDDENFNDSWTYYFTDDENTVFINTTKKTEYVESIVENDAYEKSSISGYDAVIFEEESQKNAYFVAEDIGYSVATSGVSYQDFENILVSLTK